jgi:uncharacterized protein (DUF433 family)
MAALDWSQCPAVESIPGKVSGAWVFKGTRLPVATVIENLEDLSIDEVIEQFDVRREQEATVLAFVLRACALPTSPPVLILFDHGTPKGLVRALSGHTVHTAQSRGWDTLSNGALLTTAETAGFEVLLTTDRRIRHPAEAASTAHRPRRPDGQHQVVPCSATCRAHRCSGGFRDAG